MWAALGDVDHYVEPFCGSMAVLLGRPHPHVRTYYSETANWALAHGNDPKLRIVVAGFEGEHGAAFADAGWREVEWFKGGFLRGGYAQQGEVDEETGIAHQQGRERLWCSPHCLGASKPRQGSLFAEDA